MKANQDLIKEIESRIGEKISKFETIKEGRVYLLYTDSGKKIYKEEPLFRTMDAVYFQRLCNDNSISSPEILKYGVLDGSRAYLLIEYIDNCVDVISDDIRSDDEFWMSLAQELEKLHQIPVPGFGFNRSSSAEQPKFTSSDFHDCLNIILNEVLNDLNGRDESSLVQALIKKIPSLKNHKEALLTHSDMGGNNFLWNSDTKDLYFFDAGYLRGMPKAWDLAYFGWRISPDRVTIEDYNKLQALLYPKGMSEYDLYEISFFKVLVGLLKIRDGSIRNNISKSHVEAASENLRQLLELEN